MLGVKAQMVRREKGAGGWRASSELMRCGLWVHGLVYWPWFNEAAFLRLSTITGQARRV